MVNRIVLQVAASLVLAGFGSSQTASKIVIGDGLISTGSLPAYTGVGGGTDVQFQNAINALSSGGTTAGTIEVMPGTYTFANPVNVNVAGVRISGGPNARITPRSTLTGPCFTIAATASDFVLDGVTLVDARDTPPAEIAFLDVSAPRFTLTNCRVLVSNINDPSTLSGKSHSIQILGVQDLYGALIQSNIFVLGRNTVDPPVEAPGRTLLRSEHGRNLRILGNTFQSGAAGTVMSLDNAILLVDEEWTSITGNTFSYIESPLQGAPEDNALISSRSVSAESNHLVVSANYFERCGGESIVAVSGHGFATITGNGFGRLLAGDSGAVHLAGGSGNVVSANNFHNARTAIRAVQGDPPADGLIISSNAFSLPDQTQVVVESVNGVLVEGNQFFGDTGGAPHLTLDEVTGASITGNRFTCVGSAAIGLTASSAMEVFVCANILNPGSCAASLWSATNYTVLECNVSNGNPKF